MSPSWAQYTTGELTTWLNAIEARPKLIDGRGSIGTMSAAFTTAKAFGTCFEKFETNWEASPRSNESRDRPAAIRGGAKWYMVTPETLDEKLTATSRAAKAAREAPRLCPVT